MGALVGMGVPEEEARYFETGFRSGGVLVSVNAENRAMEALQILERNGADTGSSMYDLNNPSSSSSSYENVAGVNPSPGSDVRSTSTRKRRTSTGDVNDADALAGDDAGTAHDY